MKIFKALCLSAIVCSAIILGFSINQKPTNSYTLPPLPYAYSALEPYIDTKTMEIHHTKHHQAYIDKLNQAVNKYPELKKIPLEKLLKNLDQVPEDVRTSIKNNGGGHLNHSFFWKIMTPKSSKKPAGKLAIAIDNNFGSFEKFKELFSNEAKNRFGSGWAWLCINDQGQLSIITTHDQDSPITIGLIPLLGIDVWEHAYYLKYQNNRAGYIDSWWNVVNWDEVERNLDNFNK